MLADSIQQSNVASPSGENVRNDALEEAAKACEGFAEYIYPNQMTRRSGSREDDARESAALNCADAIRALKTAAAAKSEQASAQFDVIAKLPEIHTALIQAYTAGALRTGDNGIDAGAYAEAKRIMREWELPDAPTSPSAGELADERAIEDAALDEIFDAINEAQRMNRYNESSFEIGKRLARLKCLADNYRSAMAAAQPKGANHK